MADATPWCGLFAGVAVKRAGWEPVRNPLWALNWSRFGRAADRPSLGDIVLPFTSKHAPLYTGLGVVGGYLAALLGLTFYARKRLGAKRWRQAHKATILVYVLSVVHTLGAGTDAREPWLQLFLLATGAPILFLFLVRVLPREGVGAKTVVDPAPARSTSS